MTEMLELDGSQGEGGGQILRTSLALALLTGRPFHLRNVRAGRAKPGLQPQHLMSVRAAATVGQADTRGASKGQHRPDVRARRGGAGSYTFDIGTAGATGLVLHTLYLPLALRGEVASEITLVGGTHVATSPWYHFLERTWRRYLAAFGLGVDLRLVRPGFYPRGGGRVEAVIQPWPRPRGVTLPPRGEVKATGFAAVAGLPEDIARRLARRADLSPGAAQPRRRAREETWDGGPGAVLALELDTAPAPTLFVAVGERGKPAERVADEAVDEADSPTSTPAPRPGRSRTAPTSSCCPWPWRKVRRSTASAWSRAT